MGAGDVRLRARLEPHAASAAHARRLVRKALVDGEREELLDAAELAVSELVTNAVVHTGRPVDVTVVLLPAGLRVEVADESSHLPAPRAYGPTAGTGRGLLMVQQLVHAWGVDRRSDGVPGKVVWCELGHEDVGERSDRAVERAAGSYVEVHLLGVPLLLHAAWQQHVEALLREHLLADLDRGGDAAIRTHAAASDALALLAEHLPGPELGERTEDVLAAADDPDAASADLVVPVPLASVPHFAALDQALDDALAAAVEGRFLTPRTQPELQVFRRWVCRQVEQQARGQEPEPWIVDDGLVAPAPYRWDEDPVTEAEAPVLACDDGNTIVAVSRAAAALLGYDDPTQLVGRRLVSIIPDRYRQAHLAGFTLHLYTGRRALLDHSARVPLLTRDGAEVPVELAVRAVSLPDERTVYVASLQAHHGGTAR